MLHVSEMRVNNIAFWKSNQTWSKQKKLETFVEIKVGTQQKDDTDTHVRKCWSDRKAWKNKEEEEVDVTSRCKSGP